MKKIVIKKAQHGGGGKSMKERNKRMNTADSLTSEARKKVASNMQLAQISDKHDVLKSPLYEASNRDFNAAEKLRNKKSLGPTKFKSGGKVKKGGMAAFEKSTYDKKADAKGLHGKEGSAKDMKADKTAAKRLGFIKNKKK